MQNLYKNYKINGNWWLGITIMLLTNLTSTIIIPWFKKILGYVPSAVFPAIIFPAVFLNETNTIVQINDPKIIGFLLLL